MITVGGPVPLTPLDVQNLLDRYPPPSCGLHYFDGAGAEQVCDWAEGHS